MPGQIGVRGDPVARPAVEVLSHALERVPTQHQLAAAPPAPGIPLQHNLVTHKTVQVSSVEE